MKEKTGLLRRYKMLFILEHFYPYIGGAETLFYQLTKGLVDSNVEVIVLTTRHDKSLLESEVVDGIQVVRINCKSRFSFTYSAVPHAIRLAKEVDLIHTSSYTAAVPARIAAVFSGKPLSITFHELWSSLWFNLPYLSRLQKLLYYSFEQLIISLKYDKIIAVSDFTEIALKQRRPKADVIRIYNGIDYSEYENISWQPEARYSALYLGRLGVSKGLNLIIEGIDPFLSKYKDAQIKIVIPEVPKNLSSKIRLELSKLKFSDRIIVLSSLPYPELLEHMKSSSCIVIPSYSEGFGYVGVEAAAIGIPVIGSNQGALKETITGKYINMKSMSAQSLTEALEKSYKNEWEYSNPVKFQLEDTVRNYISLFQEMRNQENN